MVHEGKEHGMIGCNLVSSVSHVCFFFSLKRQIDSNNNYCFPLFNTFY